MNVTHIEHIGIAVKDLEQTIRYYEDVLGLSCYGTETVADQGVRTAFFQVGGTKIELLESISPDGPIQKFLDKRGEGVHHIAFEVTDVDAALREAEAKGIELIDSRSKPGAEGLKIAFLHPRSTHGVLTEFCEHPNKS